MSVEIASSQSFAQLIKIEMNRCLSMNFFNLEKVRFVQRNHNWSVLENRTATAKTDNIGA